MSQYYVKNYWVKGYAEGDYVNAALSADASSDTVTAAGFLASTAAVPAATSTTLLGPYRVQHSAAKVTTDSDTDIGAGLDLFVGNLMSADGSALAAAGLNMATGAKSAAAGSLKISGRIKWEDEAEPGDTWTNRAEPSGIWTDRPEPGDTWSNY